MSSLLSLPPVSFLPEGYDQSWVTTEEGLKGLEGEWDALRRRGWTQSPFLSWDWVWGWWTQHRDLFQLAVWVVRDREGRLKAVAPLVMGKEESGSRRHLKQLGMLAGLGDAQGERMDFLIDEAELEVLGPAASAAVTVLQPYCDAVRLNKIPVDSPMRPLLQQQLEAHWAGTAVLNRTLCRFLSIPFEDWGEFQRSRSSNFRAKNKKLWRQLEERGLTKIGRAAELPDGERLLEDLFKLHAFHISEGESLFLRRRAMAFHRELFPKWLRRGLADISYLGREGQPLAMVQTLLDGTTGYTFQIGWDESLADASIGRAAMGLAVQDLWEQGAREIDFAGGDYEYKRRWTADARFLVDLEAFRSTSMRAKLFRIARAGRRRLRPEVKESVPGDGRTEATATTPV